MQWWTTVELDKKLSLLLGIEDDYLLFAHILDNRSERDLLAQCLQKYPGLIQRQNSTHPAIDALKAYFHGDYQALNQISLWDKNDSIFCKQVRDTLRTVPAGRVVEYGALARISGFPRAARAVGRVMAQNPFVLFVPCHRVVTASGGWGGFGAGIDMKRHLLGHEGVLAIQHSILWEGVHVNL